MSGAMGRIIAQSVAGIIVLIFLLLGCVESETQPDNSRNATVQASNAESTEVGEASQEGVIADVLRPAYYIPMEPEELSAVYDRYSYQWLLYYDFPEQGLRYRISYDVIGDKLEGSGYVFLNMGQDEEFSELEFSSSQPFLDLIEYIGEHTDYFFNHQEFEGQEPGELSAPEDYIEAFGLRVGARYQIDDRPVYFIIQKAVVPDDEVPEELRYVLDTIRTEFAEPIAGRPIPRPEGTNAQDSE